MNVFYKRFLHIAPEGYVPSRVSPLPLNHNELQYIFTFFWQEWHQTRVNFVKSFYNDDYHLKPWVSITPCAIMQAAYPSVMLNSCLAPICKRTLVTTYITLLEQTGQTAANRSMDKENLK